MEYRDRAIVETRDLDAHTTIEVDAEGNLLAIPVEHGSTRAEPRHLTVEGIEA